MFFKIIYLFGALTLYSTVTGNNNVTLDYPDSKIRFGRSWYYSYDNTTFFGSIQSIRIYNRVLTNEEISQNYNVDINRFNINDSSLQPQVQLAGTDISTEYYGRLTNFHSKGSGNENLLWRIFYKDSNNIYLISSKKENNIEQRVVDSQLTNTKINISDLGKSLNPLYTQSEDSWSMTSTKEQIVAYLLDPTEWDSYTDQAGNASWAIGGPPLEMYTNSLEQTFPSLIDNVWVAAGYGYRYSGTIATTPCIENSFRHGIYGGDRLTSYTISSPCGSWGSNDRICGINVYVGDSKGIFWNQEEWKWAGYCQNVNKSQSPDGNLRPIVCIPTNKFNYTIYNY